MQINFNKSTTSFKATPIYSLKLKQISGTKVQKNIPATFSRLSITDFNDVNLMYKLKREWTKNNFNLINYIYTDFFSYSKSNIPEKEFYIVEQNIPFVDTYDRVKAIMEVTSPSLKDKDVFEIDFLQSKSAIFENEKSIKGAGELSVYSAIKLALENGFKQLYIHSVENSFYKKIGLTPVCELDSAEGYFVLDKADFQGFLNKTESKYNMIEK